MVGHWWPLCSLRRQPGGGAAAPAPGVVDDPSRMSATPGVVEPGRGGWVQVFWVTPTRILNLTVRLSDGDRQLTHWQVRRPGRQRRAAASRSIDGGLRVGAWGMSRIIDTTMISCWW